MNKSFWLKNSLFFSYIFIIIFISSCRTGDVTYFTDLKDSAQAKPIITEIPFESPVIKPYDILKISVQTMVDNSSTHVFTDFGDAAMKGGSKTGDVGYRVDPEGYIELPVFGRLKVAGLSLDQAREAIKEKAQKYYIDPVVQVSYLDFYVIVYGDISKAGRVVFERDKVNIMDLLSESGDLRITAQRDNILVIREENGHRSWGRLNINSSDIFKSPYFYLHSGDIVYVEPNRVRAKQATIDRTNDRYITYVSTSLGIISVLYTLIIRVQQNK